MPATFKPDSRNVMSMTNEQFQAELAYQTARQMADHFQKCGLLTDEEFAQIDTILLTKYRPIFGIIFVDLLSVQS